MATAPPKTSCLVSAYAEAVASGNVVAGALVRKACQRHLDDLKTGPARGLRWDQAAADRANEFFGYLRQSKGRWANEPLALLPWQAFIIGSIFGWKRANGTRRFRSAYTEVARKQGKSTLAAGVALYLLDFDGEPGAEVYAAATKRDQAKIVWSEAASMVRRTTALNRRVKIVDSRANMHILDTSSKFEALGKDSDSLDGLNVHGAIIDELHAHPTRYIVDVLETAAGARTQPMFFYITTAGIASKETIYQETHQRARRVVEGIIEDDSLFAYIASLDPEDDWADPAVYPKANPSLGITILLDELVAERDKALDTPGRQNAFRRLRLNQQTEQVSRWLDMALWDTPEAAAPIDSAALEGRPCWGGLDLSTTTDLTALVLVFRDEDGGYILLPHFWVPEENLRRRAQRDRVPYDLWANQGHLAATPGNVVDYQAIVAKVRELSSRYRVQEIAFDPWNATGVVTQLQEEGANMVEVRQGYASLTAPAKEFEKAVTSKRLRHGGHPVLRWNAANVSVEQDPAGNLKPSKAKSTERIDGVVAAIMAVGRAMVGDDGHSIYESRGLATL